ncbi:MAG: iron-containing alcohol dehydrogenase [Clostridia bacterium]|nr:iron-containing alcohol dehydrogenase [Clostridia bacterium]
MQNFIFHTPTKVYFGKNEELKVGKIIKEYGAKKVLIHFGSKSAKESGLLERVENCLREENIEYVEFGGVKPNPELKLVRKGIELCIKENVDFILAVGGGSVIDSAKDIANGAANPEVDVWEFSKKKLSPEKSIRKGVILTLSAAGSEMSASCVITNEETGEKRGYNSVFNRVDFAIENPELTYSVSAYQTACGTVDIGMHTMERYFCAGEGTYVTDAVAEAVMKTVMKAGSDAIKNPKDYNARANMMWASSISHNDLTHVGKTLQLAVHQLEHELSGMYPEIAHGAGLAALWASWARFMYKADLNKFLQFATNVWNLDINFENPEETVLKAIKLQEDFYKSIGMPISLRELDVKEDDLETLAFNCSFKKGRELTGAKKIGCDEMLEIYRMAY